MDKTTTEPVAPEDDAIMPDEPDAQSDDSADDTAAPPAEPTTTDEPEQSDNSEEAMSEYASLKEWADKKGYDLATEEGQARAWKSMREAEQLMHSSTVKASQLEKSLTNDIARATAAGDTDVVNELVAEVQNLKLTQSVNTFWSANPEAKALEQKMADIVSDQPAVGQMVKAGYLSLDQLYAMARGMDSSRDEQLKADGGKEALKQVASKQQAKAVVGAATNSDFADQTPDDPFLKGFEEKDK